MKKALIIYHSVDSDGLMSMAITKKALESAGMDVATKGYNYKEEDVAFLRAPVYYDLIAAVDCSFPADIMKIIAPKLVWIDHHETAIKSSQENGYSGVQGKRLSGKAACELCWEFFYPGVEMPKSVLYCGIYDTWRKDEIGEGYWNSVILPFQYALRSELGTNPGEWENAWDDIIVNQENTNNLLRSGLAIQKYLKQFWENSVKGGGFPVVVAGKYKGICILGRLGSSACFDCVRDLYDIYVTATKNSDGSYSVSAYKEPSRLPDFSLGKYMAANYNGGGHVSSAGGTMTLDQFIRLINEGRM